jgi:hypothetical protein
VGRSPSRCRRIGADGAAPVSEKAERFEQRSLGPSGPNSVPRQTARARPTFLPQAAVLDERARRPANWSMFHP